MAGNCHGVLIFVTFVVDLAVTKFSHSRKLMPMVICELKSMMMDVATNIVAARPILSSISKQCIVAIVIQLIASSTLIFFYLILLILSKSLYRCGL